MSKLFWLSLKIIAGAMLACSDWSLGQVIIGYVLIMTVICTAENAEQDENKETN